MSFSIRQLAAFSSEAMPYYKLHVSTLGEYSGEAEGIRLLCAVGRVPYGECTVSPDEWLTMKTGLPALTHSLPLVTVDGKPLASTMAICRYIANIVDLDGDDTLEMAQCDSVARLAYDADLQWQAYQRGTAEEAGHAERWQELQLRHLLPFLATVERTLERNKTGYLVTSAMTWPDVFVCAVLRAWLGDFPTLLAARPMLMNFLERCRAALPYWHQHGPCDSVPSYSRPASALQRAVWTRAARRSSRSTRLRSASAACGRTAPPGRCAPTTPSARSPRRPTAMQTRTTTSSGRDALVLDA